MKMIDALHPNSIPEGTSCDIVAAYIDHTANLNSFAQAVTRFPNAIHIKISVRGTIGADVLDCEKSTIIDPADCVPWVKASREAGIDPTIYCNQMDSTNGWPAIRQAFHDANVAEPHYWVAKYDGDPKIPSGAVAKQFTDLDPSGHNTYDTSSTISSWPTNSEDDMPLTAQELTAITGEGRVSTQRVGDAVHEEADAIRSAVMGPNNVDNSRLGDVLRANTDGLIKSVATMTAQVAALLALVANSGSLDAIQAKSIALEAAQEAVNGITVEVHSA